MSALTKDVLQSALDEAWEESSDTTGALPPADLVEHLYEALAPQVESQPLDVERLTLILGDAEDDNVIGPDYTPDGLATYIAIRLAAEESE